METPNNFPANNDNPISTIKKTAKTNIAHAFSTPRVMENKFLMKIINKAENFILNNPEERSNSISYPLPFGGILVADKKHPRIKTLVNHETIHLAQIKRDYGSFFKHLSHIMSYRKEVKKLKKMGFLKGQLYYLVAAEQEAYRNQHHDIANYLATRKPGEQGNYLDLDKKILIYYDRFVDKIIIDNDVNIGKLYEKHNKNAGKILEEIIKGRLEQSRQEQSKGDASSEEKSGEEQS